MYCAGKQEAFLSSHATCVRARQGARIEHRSHSFHIAGVSSSKDTTLSQESNVQVDKVNVKHATRPHNTQQIMQTVWEKVVIFMDFAVLERLPRKASLTGALPSIAHIHITFLSSEGAAFASLLCESVVCVGIGLPLPET